MKYFTIALLFISSLASAATSQQFVIGNQEALAFVRSTDPFGHTDTDAFHLLQLMNVAPQNSPVGVGKNIVTKARDFNLICGQAQNMCEVVLTHSSRNLLSPEEKRMRFTVDGPEAAELIQKFHLNAQGDLLYRTFDKKFKIQGRDQHFEFESADQPLE